jgi:hypothetical protein
MRCVGCRLEATAGGQRQWRAHGIEAQRLREGERELTGELPWSLGLSHVSVWDVLARSG